jgi:hypothetical protein
MMETEAATHRCLEPFQWESLRGCDFRPQLIIVSGLFGGNPFMDGILGHNLLLSQAFFHNLVFFSRWNSRYQKAFLTNFCFFTMEFWLSGSLSHELFFFHDGILAIKKPFSRTFFFLHNGILAIKKPFSRTFFFLHDGILAIRKPFSRTFLFFHDGILAIRKPFSRTFLFSRWNSRNTQFGRRLFIYIYITKSIYTGSVSLKTLPLDLEPPLQGKEYGPPYSNATKKRKANVFSRNHL